jgi:hypothetical protein
MRVNDRHAAEHQPGIRGEFVDVQRRRHGWRRAAGDDQPRGLPDSIGHPAEEALQRAELGGQHARANGFGGGSAGLDGAGFFQASPPRAVSSSRPGNPASSPVRAGSSRRDAGPPRPRRRAWRRCPGPTPPLACRNAGLRRRWPASDRPRAGPDRGSRCARRRTPPARPAAWAGRPRGRCRNPPPARCVPSPPRWTAARRRGGRLPGRLPGRLRAPGKPARRRRDRPARRCPGRVPFRATTAT